MFERLNQVASGAVSMQDLTPGAAPERAALTQEMWVALPGTLARIGTNGELTQFSLLDAPAPLSATAREHAHELGLSASRLLTFSHPDHGSMLVDLDSGRVFRLDDAEVLRCVVDRNSCNAWKLPEISHVRFVEVAHAPEEASAKTFLFPVSRKAAGVGIAAVLTAGTALTLQYLMSNPASTSSNSGPSSSPSADPASTRPEALKESAPQATPLVTSEEKESSVSPPPALADLVAPPSMPPPPVASAEKPAEQRPLPPAEGATPAQISTSEPTTPSPTPAPSAALEELSLPSREPARFVRHPLGATIPEAAVDLFVDDARSTDIGPALLPQLGVSLPSAALELFAPESSATASSTTASMAPRSWWAAGLSDAFKSQSETLFASLFEGWRPRKTAKHVEVDSPIASSGSMALAAPLPTEALDLFTEPPSIALGAPHDVPEPGFPPEQNEETRSAAWGRAAKRSPRRRRTADSVLA